MGCCRLCLRTIYCQITMNVFYCLKLKDGSTCQGVLIPNDLIKEKVWRTKDGYVFEDAVQTATELEKQENMK